MISRFPFQLALRVSPAILLAAVGALSLTVPRAAAQSAAPFTTLHAFDATDADQQYNVEGFAPGELVQAKDGNFYGTNRNGGLNANGTVFQLTPGGTFTVLHTFQALSYNGSTIGQNADGGYPAEALTPGSDGSLYGTTSVGGLNGYGTFFRLTPDGTLTTLYNFDRTVGSIYYSGANPERLVQGSDGNFYGANVYGGTSSRGTIYQLTPAGQFTLLHNFGTGTSTSNPADPTGEGFYPSALFPGSDGNFYGIAGAGGANRTGTVFQITPAGALTVLHTFTAAPGGSNADGAYPVGGLVAGRDGSFYGVANGGGTSGSGTVFKLTATGDFTSLYSFSGLSEAEANEDGASPASRLLLGSDGLFYGVTDSGGANGTGTVFGITSAGALTFAHTFSALNDVDRSGDQPVGTNGDGAEPESALFQGSDGSLYGTTFTGGANAAGVIYQLALVASHPPFFQGEAALANGVYYLSFPGGSPFGYYSYLTDPNYIFHFDLGYEYVFDAADGKGGVYFYDFASSGFFYTSPGFPFPYLYDFSLNSVVYYYPDPNNAGHYNTNGVRYFYVFNTSQIISK